MTNEEMKAAESRLRYWLNLLPTSAPSHATCLDIYAVLDGIKSRLAADEQQSKDDAEPITECWLESLGWLRWDDRDDVYSGELYCIIGKWLGWETRLTFHLGSVEAVRMCDPDEADGLSAECVTLLGNPCSKSNRPARGQLRKLLEALKGGDV